MALPGAVGDVDGEGCSGLVSAERTRSARPLVGYLEDRAVLREGAELYLGVYSRLLVHSIKRYSYSALSAHSIL